jgi:hypothetical protein
MPGAERTRVESFGQLSDGLREGGDWYLWGPYLSERQWGTVREDYSPGGDAWGHLPHDHARSRAYRWGEDGMAGFSDVEQRLCLSLALWNGRDPILKERMFGLTGSESNHGEDVKEHWWFVDAVPSHAWNRWRYHYPQQAYPYDDLIAESARRRSDRTLPEYELLDTGVFDAGYWIVEVDWAKASPTDVLMSVRATNAGPGPDRLHLLPTAWFRNTWSWTGDHDRPRLAAGDEGRIDVEHPFLGPLELVADGEPEALFCENETNAARLYRAEPTTPWPKDGINDHVVSGADTVNPAGEGTRAALWYRLDVDPGTTVEVRLRLRPRGARPVKVASALGRDFTAVVNRRRDEADEFHAELRPEGATDDEAAVMRQALAGMLWSKQLYYYDVSRWLDGDPALPAPPESRRHGRNARWSNFDAFDIMSMPDPWEYPWFAAWDLAFHCVALAHVDPAFGKYQLLLLCREWFQHPSGALPAYEWDFGDVNPPVQAWAALEVFAIDGGRDLDFLSRVFDKLLINFTWWVNREDEEGNNLFEGGFLGLDNIGPIDRSHLPVGGRLEQSDATGWMAFYALSMGTIASLLDRVGMRPGTDLQIKFLEHFAAITRALESLSSWDPSDGLYYDKLVTADGTVVPVRVRSMVGIIPLLAAVVVDEHAIARAEAVGKQFARLLADDDVRGREQLEKEGLLRGGPGERRLLLGVVPVERLRRILTRLFDEDEFLSPHGLRALSAYHRDHPYEINVEGVRAVIDYEPAESTTSMFGGNSNWRGPVWFPLNYLLIGALERYARFFGDDFTIEYPTGSGVELTLAAIAADLRRRLISIFLRGPDGRRPCFGWVDRLQDDPAWRDHLVFNEYFHGDNGAGLGASHQTGWTGLVADLIRGRPGAGVYGVSDLPRVLADRAARSEPKERPDAVVPPP